MIPRRRHSPMRRNTASICLADMRRSNDRRQPTCDLAHQFPNEHILAHRGGSRQSASERKPTRNERGNWDSIYLPATAGRLSSSDVSLLCCAPLRHCWLAQTDCPLCGSSSSMPPAGLCGRQCSELADTCLEKAFVE